VRHSIRIAVVEDGRTTRMEIFDAVDEAAAQVRFAELAGVSPPRP
jgi:hypothetical protein